MNAWNAELISNIELYLSKLEIVKKDKDAVFALMNKAAEMFNRVEDEKSQHGTIYKTLEQFSEEHDEYSKKIEELQEEIELKRDSIDRKQNELDEEIKFRDGRKHVIENTRFKFFRLSRGDYSSYKLSEAEVARLEKEKEKMTEEMSSLKSELANAQNELKVVDEKYNSLDEFCKENIYNPNYNYLDYLNDNDEVIVKYYIKNVISISQFREVDDSFNVLGSTTEQFKNLLLLIGISINNYINNKLELEYKFSLPAKDLFLELQSDRCINDSQQSRNYTLINFPNVVAYATSKYFIGVNFFANQFYRKVTFHENFYILNKDFLTNLLELVKSNEDANLPTLAILLSKKMGFGMEHMNKLYKFKSLYEETPEQILITEQRYFAEQRAMKEENRHQEMLNQMEENARLERIRRDYQAERDREFERVQAEENRQQQERLAREQADREQQYLRQQQELQRQERERQNDLAYIQHEREKREQEHNRRMAHQQCVGCANYGRCRNLDTPNCGAFRPK
jgi:hypothetical protein